MYNQTEEMIKTEIISAIAGEVDLFEDGFPKLSFEFYKGRSLERDLRGLRDLYLREQEEDKARQLSFLIHVLKGM